MRMTPQKDVFLAKLQMRSSAPACHGVDNPSLNLSRKVRILTCPSLLLLLQSLTANLLPHFMFDTVHVDHPRGHVHTEATP